MYIISCYCYSLSATCNYRYADFRSMIEVAPIICLHTCMVLPHMSITLPPLWHATYVLSFLKSSTGLTLFCWLEYPHQWQYSTLDFFLQRYQDALLNSSVYLLLKCYSLLILQRTLIDAYFNIGGPFFQHHSTICSSPLDLAQKSLSWIFKSISPLPCSCRVTTHCALQNWMWFWLIMTPSTLSVMSIPSTMCSNTITLILNCISSTDNIAVLDILELTTLSSTAIMSVLPFQLLTNQGIPMVVVHPVATRAVAFVPSTMTSTIVSFSVAPMSVRLGSNSPLPLPLRIKSDIVSFFLHL